MRIVHPVLCVSRVETSTPIDLFFAYDALHEATQAAIRRQPFANTMIPVLAPERLLDTGA